MTVYGVHAFLDDPIEYLGKKNRGLANIEAGKKK